MKKIKSPKKPGQLISKMNAKKEKMEEKSEKKSMKKKGKGILKALGEKKATGNFKKIAKAKGKGAAIASLQNKLAKRRGQKVPYGGKK